MEHHSEELDPRSRIAVRPVTVAGVSQPCICLDGEWEFTLDPWPGVPGDAALAWRPVTVPGEPAMQGFAIENGRYYYYRRVLRLPTDFAGKEIALRFEGVHSDARVWVNGTLVGSHRSPATIWECDIMRVAPAGTDAVLVVGVLDDLQDPSILSRYAGHNTGGILRSVFLLARPRTHLRMMHIGAGLSADGRTGLLTIEAAVADPGKQTACRIEMIAPSGRALLPLPPEPVTAEGCIRINASIEDVLGWDAEHPRLYELRCILQEGGATLEEHTEHVGFRRITFGGADGTDPRKVFVNGRPIKLRGVCLHDWSLKAGRCTTPEQNRSNVARLRECNVNYIRTSHYPPPMALVEECDRQGMYLEVETALCFQHGILGRDQVADYLSRFVEMVEACRNHPSVLIWSLGNESSWNEGTSAEYDWVKRNEPTRPVTFSWPLTIFEEHVPMDLFSGRRPSVPARRDCPCSVQQPRGAAEGPQRAQRLGRKHQAALERDL
jgi:beta-galactosidase/beta-glucuronidase